MLAVHIVGREVWWPGSFVNVVGSMDGERGEKRRGSRARTEEVDGLLYDFQRSNVSSEKQDGCREVVEWIGSNGGVAQL